jgi:hypothetical protein
MIPGLYFDSDHCICIYRWKNSSIQFKQMSEIWIIEPGNKKVCYIDPKEGIPFFNKYHIFDEVIDANIDIIESSKLLKISVCKNNNEIIHLEINLKTTIENLIANYLLKVNNRKFITGGKTETGKTFSNKPEKIISVFNAKALLNGKNIGKVIKPRKYITFGDGKISEKPIVNYCSHDIEE